MSTGCVGALSSPAAVSPNRSRKRGPAGEKWAAGVIERSNSSPSVHSPNYASLVAQPWLRLVRATSNGVGAVSPELALVDPPLATEARLTPDTVIVAAETERRFVPAESLDLERAARLPATDDHSPKTSVLYDTRDLVLERHGLRLELLYGRARTWRLTAARGEVVEASEDEPGIPRAIESLLRNVVLEGELLQVPARSPDPEIRRLEHQIAEQHHSLVKHDVGARIASDPESLHQLRVAARRVRTYLTVGRDLVDSEWAKEMKGGMRALGRASNEARDIDILLDKLRDQLRAFDPHDQAAGTALIRTLEEDRRDLQEALVAVLNSNSYRRVLDRMALPAAPASASSTRKLDQIASRELRGLVARVRSLGKRPGNEALHDLRIQVKRVRYATELGGAPSDKRSRRVVDAATRMQDILGEHQDSVVGEERLREVAYRFDESGVAFVAGRLAERERTRQSEIQQDLPSAWKQLRKLARHSK
jgi:CHAD domain-containing protein